MNGKKAVELSLSKKDAEKLRRILQRFPDLEPEKGLNSDLIELARGLVVGISNELLDWNHK